MDKICAASVEFLGLLADIYHPGTGIVSQARLGVWLGMTQAGLEIRRESAGGAAWPSFANDILAVLDVLQDRTKALPLTLAWYRHAPASSWALSTPDYLVSRGRTAEAIREVRRARVPDWSIPEHWIILPDGSSGSSSADCAGSQDSACRQGRSWLKFWSA